MKKIHLFIALIAICFMSCERDKTCYSGICACGIENPATNIEWLADLIKKAEADKAGNYRGSIWLEKYKGNDVFVTDMSFGSGGIMYTCFDCQGNTFIPDDEFIVTKKNLIYTNFYFSK